MVLLVYWQTSLSANLLLNASAGGKISRQASRGSFATLSTHFKWITGFDAGSQALSLTCAGCCGQHWLVFLTGATTDDSSTSLLNTISFIITQPSLSTFSVSTSGLWRQSPTRRLEKGRNLHLHVCNLAFISKLKTVYCMAMRVFVTMVTDLTQEEEGSNLIIKSYNRKWS